MTKKGFTLIELLAVIVILAIIALIAVPIVLGIIEDSRKSATLRSAEHYLSGVEQAVARAMLNGNTTIDPNGTYSINGDGDICIGTDCIEVEVDGEKPKAGGTITLSSGSITSAKFELNSKPIVLANGKLDYEEDTGGGNNTAVCTYVDSTEYENTAGEVDRNDIVTCGTESFYVIDNDGENVTMLSMYNLNVGDNKYPNEGTYGIQDEHAVASSLSDIQEEIVGVATSAVVTTNYWYDSDTDTLKSEYGENYPAYIYRSNIVDGVEQNVAFPYVNSYEEYLKEELKVTSASASLISYQKLLDLGCDDTKQTCGPDLGNGAPQNPAPAWVYSTTYWSGSARNNSNDIYIVLGGMFAADDGDSAHFVGIRPLVTISVDEF